ncbi:uncharacterized protein [Diadema antillarum]|uniref:uncharacterized protein n=1 Tax=Diadema antillarum TaxID=105358 RepID=UPI003A83EBD3
MLQLNQAKFAIAHRIERSAMDHSQDSVTPAQKPPIDRTPPEDPDEPLDLSKPLDLSTKSLETQAMKASGDSQSVEVHRMPPGLKPGEKPERSVTKADKLPPLGATRYPLQRGLAYVQPQQARLPQRTVSTEDRQPSAQRTQNAPAGTISSDQVKAMRNYAPMHQRVRAEAANIAAMQAQAMQAQASQAAQAAVNSAMARRAAFPGSKIKISRTLADASALAAVHKQVQQPSIGRARIEERQKRLLQGRTASVHPVQRELSSAEVQAYLRNEQIAQAQLAARRGNHPDYDLLNAYRTAMLSSDVASRVAPSPKSHATLSRDGATTSQADRMQDGTKRHADPNFIAAARRSSHLQQKPADRSVSRNKETDFAAQVRAREQALIKKQRELILLQQRQLFDDINNRTLQEYAKTYNERKTKMEDLKYKQYANLVKAREEMEASKHRTSHKFHQTTAQQEFAKAMAAYNASLLSRHVKGDHASSSPPMPILMPQDLYSAKFLQSQHDMNGSHGRNTQRPEMISPPRVQVATKRSSDMRDDIIPSKRKAVSPVSSTAKSFESRRKDARAAWEMAAAQQSALAHQLLVNAQEKRSKPLHQPHVSTMKNQSGLPARGALSSMSEREKEELLFLTRYGQLANRQFIQSQYLDSLRAKQQNKIPIQNKEKTLLTSGSKVDASLIHAMSKQPAKQQSIPSMKSGISKSIIPQNEIPSIGGHRSQNNRDTVHDLTSSSPASSPEVISPNVVHDLQPGKRHTSRLPSYDDAIAARQSLARAMPKDQLTTDVMSDMAKRLVFSSQEWLKKVLTKDKEVGAEPTSSDLTNGSTPNSLLNGPFATLTGSGLSVSQKSIHDDVLADRSVNGHSASSAQASVSPRSITDTRVSTPGSVPPQPVPESLEIPRVGRSLSHDPRKKLLAALGSDVSSAESSEGSFVDSPIPAALGVAPEGQPETSATPAERQDSSQPEVKKQLPLKDDTLPAEKKDPNENDLMQADSASLGSEERALQRAIIRFNEPDQQTPESAEQEASAVHGRLSGGRGRVAQRRRRRKLSKFRRRVRSSRAHAIINGSENRPTGRKRGRPRRSTVPLDMDLNEARRSRFQDFVPTILTSRTRNAGTGPVRNYRSMYDTRNVRYELEIERERAKVVERRLRLRANNCVDNAPNMDNDNAIGNQEEGEPLVKRKPRGRPPKYRPDDNVRVARRAKNAATFSDETPSSNNDGEPPTSPTHPLRVVLDENSSNRIKMKFVNIRSVQAGENVDPAPPRRKRGRPPKASGKVGKIRGRAAVQGSPNSPEPPTLERMPHYNENDRGSLDGDYMQDGDYDVIDTGMTSSEYMDTPIIRPDPPPEMKKLLVNKKLGETALHRSATLGYMEIVAYCVDYRAVDVNARDNAGYTALHESCVHGHLNVAQYLLSHGADVNASAADGTRPIHDAVDNDHVEVMRLLLAYGADPFLSTYSGRRTTKLALARSSAMKTLLFGYLRDVNGDRTKLKDFPQRPLDYQWNFSGSCSLFDTASEANIDIFADAPAPEEESCQPASEAQDDGVFFEISEQPVLPSFNFRLQDQDKFRNWLMLDHVAERLSLTPEELLAKHPKVVPVTLPVEQFQQSVQESQVSQSSFPCAAAGLRRACPTSEPSAKGEEVTIVELDDELRNLLGVEIEHFR